MNIAEAQNAVQWLFLDLNAFFASCEQQETPALRGKPIIVVQTLTESACAIAANGSSVRSNLSASASVTSSTRTGTIAFFVV